MTMILARAAERDAVLFRAAVIEPASLDDDARKVRATITTGAPIKRRLWGEEWTERLDISAIKTADLIGLPVVDSHNIHTTDSIRGVVVDAGRDQGGIWTDIPGRR